MKLQTPEQFINSCTLTTMAGPVGIVSAKQLRLRDAEVMSKAAELVMKLMPPLKPARRRPDLALRRAATSLALTAKLIQAGEYNL